MSNNLSGKQRSERRGRETTDKYRSESRRDRDRIRYSRLFRRLSGVTQVAHSEESYLFHNRLTHSMKVANLAASLARMFYKRKGVELKYAAGMQLNNYPQEGTLEATLDPYTVEAASHAHDLGHPPFGHAGEDELNDIVEEKSEEEVDETHGFEGNAQSFRMISSLGYYDEANGMALTRATLNATLKYPWSRGDDEYEEDEKWGYYDEPHTQDADIFNWARRPIRPVRRKEKVFEAQVMDFADDVTYAVHDLIDFFKTGIIPLDSLFREAIGQDSSSNGSLDKYGTDSSNELSEFKIYLKDETDVDPSDIGDGLTLSEFLLDIIRDQRKELYPAILSPYRDTDEERRAMRELASDLVSQYLESNRVSGNNLSTEEKTEGIYDLINGWEDQITVLKSLTKYYVITNPTLMQQQHGQRKVLRELYEFFYSEAESVQDCKHPKSIIPSPYRQRIQNAGETTAPLYRCVSDLVSSLTEQQALQLHKRLVGQTPGSLHNDIVG